MPAPNEKSNEQNQTTSSRKSPKVRRDRSQWIAIIEAQRASGLSIEAFCIANDISRSGFWRWSKELGGTEGTGAVNPIEPRFLPIPIKAVPSCGLELELGAMRMRLDGSAMERVIDAIVKRIATQA
jgi:hypothetical protein